MNIKNKELLYRFGKMLRQLREARGISQETLANIADIPINQIGRIERGEINTSLITLGAIAKAFNITLADLFDQV